MTGAAAVRKSSFAPVADGNARVLILGSLPGEVSLARAQYYGHPRNQFWRLMSEVLRRPLPGAYEARLAALQAGGVALWDVVASAERVGSLDTNIKAPEANPLAEFVATLPRLKAVGFNGGKSLAIGRPALAGSGVALVPLPSSSPAYTLAFAEKALAWGELRRFLDL